MKSIIILLIILLGALIFYNFIYKVIEPLSGSSDSCSENSKASAKLSAMGKSIDNFQKSTNSKLIGLETSMKLISPLISTNRTAAENNKKELKKLTKKIEAQMNKQGGKMDDAGKELDKL